MFEAFDITLMGTDENFNREIVARKVIEAEAILVASPAYLQARGMPQVPKDLLNHECLMRVKQSNGRSRPWRMWRVMEPGNPVEIPVTPMIVANHTDTLLRATLDGAGIISVAVDIVAPYLTRGELVRVLSPWITGRFVIYAALPSRKFIPQRTRAFLDFLVEQSRMHASAGRWNGHSYP